MIACLCFGVGEALVAIGLTGAAAAAHKIICKCKCHKKIKNKKISLDNPPKPAILRVKSKTK